MAINALMTLICLLLDCQYSIFNDEPRFHDEIYFITWKNIIESDQRLQ